MMLLLQQQQLHGCSRVGLQPSRRTQNPAAAAAAVRFHGGVAVTLPPQQQQQQSSKARRPPMHCRSVTTAAAAAGSVGTQLSLHLGETTIQMPFTAEQAKTLDAALSKLLQTFAEKQAAARPKRWDTMEVRFSSSDVQEQQSGMNGQSGLELLEVFCNPNTFKTAFDAKLMVTAKSAGLKVVCEGRLSSIKADVDAFINDVVE